MIKQHFEVLSLAILVIATGFLWPQNVFAGDPTQAFMDLFLETGVAERGLSSAVVAAVREGLTGELMMSLFKNLRDNLEAGIGAAMMLAVLIFGARVVTNDFRHHLEMRSQMILLAIKLAIINLFLFNIVPIMQLLLEMPEDLIVIVMGVLDFSETVGCGLGTHPNLGSIAGDPQINELWWKIDCLFLNSFGISIAGAGMSAGLGIVISSTFSGLMGSYVTYTGIAAFMGLLFTIMRVTYSYVASMVVICFLFALTPLFLPMILFQATKGFFDKWLNLIIGFLLQPMMVSVGLMFIILMFNTALFTAENSLVNTLFPGVLGQDVNATDWQSLNEILYERTLDTNALATDSGASPCDPESDTDFVEEAGNPVTAAERFGCSMGGDVTSLGPLSLAFPIMQQTVNYSSDQFGWIQDGGGTGNPAEDAALVFEGMRQLILAYASVLLVSFASYVLMEQMDTLGKRLTNFSFRLQIPFALPGENQFKQAMSRAQSITESNLRRDLPMGGLMGGMMAGEDGLANTLGAYRGGMAGGLSTLPFVGDALAGTLYGEQLGQADNTISRANTVLSGLTNDPTQDAASIQTLAVEIVNAQEALRSVSAESNGLPQASERLAELNELIASNPQLQQAVQAEQQRRAAAAGG